MSDNPTKLLEDLIDFRNELILQTQPVKNNEDRMEELRIRLLKLESTLIKKNKSPKIQQG